MSRLGKLYKPSGGRPPWMPTANLSPFSKGLDWPILHLSFPLLALIDKVSALPCKPVRLFSRTSQRLVRSVLEVSKQTRHENTRWDSKQVC